MANENNKEELGAAYLQEKYEVSGNPDEVCDNFKFSFGCLYVRNLLCIFELRDCFYSHS